MKVILLTTLLLFSVNGFAFNWKKVVEGDLGNSFYVDIDSIKKHNRLVYYWVLVDLPEPTKYGDYSYIGKFKVNCEIEELTWLSSTFYSQSMGKGRINSEENPTTTEYPKPKTIGYDVMKFACKNAR